MSDMTDLTGYDLACDAFAERLADYLEGDLSQGSREALDAHLARCASCAALLEELQRVTATASALPPLVPSRDLWAGIAERIDAAVLPLDGARDAGVARRVHPRWSRPAIAAAALVVITAGVTHVLTRAAMAPAKVATTAASVPVPVPTSPAPVRDSRPRAGAQPTVQVASATRAPARRAAAQAAHAADAADAARDVAPPSRAATVRLARAEPLLHDVEPVYRQEIEQLRRIVRDRRSQLDPATIAVLEQSVAVIDSAIAQSRTALAKDPASGLLATQLNHSLEKKVELLRTAALLPSRS